MPVIRRIQNQYIRLIDTRSGVMRVERGEASVVIGPTEKVVEDVREGVNIDEHTAVVVVDTVSGQRSLVTEVSAQPQEGHSQVGIGNSLNRSRRRIAGALIHLYEREIMVKRIDQFTNAPVRLFDNPLFVEDGNHKVNSCFL